MTTVDNLELRVAALEQEVSRLKTRVPATAPELSGELAGARMIREAEEKQAELAAAWHKLMRELGVKGPPITAAELRELMIAAGWNANDNAVSRELIAMREE
jgi:hypothetical protein